MKNSKTYFSLMRFFLLSVSYIILFPLTLFLLVSLTVLLYDCIF
nr:MAG TPA: hypothetical protein [Caudoviricetes sp.]